MKQFIFPFMHLYTQWFWYLNLPLPLFGRLSNPKKYVLLSLFNLTLVLINEYNFRSLYEFLCDQHRLNNSIWWIVIINQDFKENPICSLPDKLDHVLWKRMRSIGTVTTMEFYPFTRQTLKTRAIIYKTPVSKNRQGRQSFTQVNTNDWCMSYLRVEGCRLHNHDKIWTGHNSFYSVYLHPNSLTVRQKTLKESRNSWPSPAVD